MAKLKDTIIKNHSGSKILDIQDAGGSSVCSITPEGYFQFADSGANIGIGKLSNPFVSSTAYTDSSVLNLPNIPSGEGQTVSVQLPWTAQLNTTYTVSCPLVTSSRVSSFRFFLGTSSAIDTSLPISEPIQAYSTTSSGFQFSFKYNEDNQTTSNNYIWCKTSSPNETAPALDMITITYVKDSATINDSVAIGNGAKAQATGVISIGNNAGLSATGNFASTNIGCPGGNTYKIALGAGNVNLLYYSGGSPAVAITSDRRDKTDIQKIEYSTEFLKKLTPITYVDNNRYEYCLNGDINTFDEELYKTEKLKGERRHAGLIAQDVYKTLCETYDSNNYADIVDYNRFDADNIDESQFDKYFMRYESLIPFLIKGFQEQQARIEELENEIKKLKQ